MAEAIIGPNLPQEAVTEILSWLPIKPLFRFRCVSKSWFQLLTLDPQFAKMHRDRSILPNKLNPNPSILAVPCDREDLLLAIDYTACDKAIHLDLPFHEGGDNRYEISGLCNGLLCLRCNDDACIYVWNPLTKDYITIYCPPHPYIDSPDTVRKTVFGFGWVQENNEYKVMRATFCVSELEIVHGIDDVDHIFHSQVSVYTLGVDSSWRIIDEDFQYKLSDATDHITLVNGVLHWIAWEKRRFSPVHILGFDMKDEIFREIPPPIALNSPGTYAVIGELGGYLCICTRDNESFLDIWMMKEYGVFNSWTKMLKMPKADVSFFYLWEAVGMTPNGDFILKLYLQDLYLCNLDTRTVAELKQFGFSLCTTNTFRGSLISPRVISRPGHSRWKAKLEGKEKAPDVES